MADAHPPLDKTTRTGRWPNNDIAQLKNSNRSKFL